MFQMINHSNNLWLFIAKDSAVVMKGSQVCWLTNWWLVLFRIACCLLTSLSLSFSFSGSQIWGIVGSLAVPRGPRLPAKACPHALPQALPVRAWKYAFRKLWLRVSTPPSFSHISFSVSQTVVLPSFGQKSSAKFRDRGSLKHISARPVIHLPACWYLG